MPSTTIRIDPDTYRHLLEAKAKLELSTAKVQSFNTTVAFLLTLSHPHLELQRMGGAIPGSA